MRIYMCPRCKNEIKIECAVTQYNDIFKCELCEDDFNITYLAGYKKGWDDGQFDLLRKETLKDLEND